MVKYNDIFYKSSGMDKENYVCHTFYHVYILPVWKD